MILVDTSVWIDHLRQGDKTLARLLDDGRVLTHPFVIGELALGRLRQRKLVLGTLQDLPHTGIPTHHEVLGFIEQEKLFALGIGYVDAHLLTAVRLTPGALLWSRDKKLAAAAGRLSLAV